MGLERIQSIHYAVNFAHDRLALHLGFVLHKLGLIEIDMAYKKGELASIGFCAIEDPIRKLKLEEQLCHFLVVDRLLTIHQLIEPIGQFGYHEVDVDDIEYVERCERSDDLEDVEVVIRVFGRANRKVNDSDQAMPDWLLVVDSDIHDDSEHADQVEVEEQKVDSAAA